MALESTMVNLENVVVRLDRMQTALPLPKDTLFRIYDQVRQQEETILVDKLKLIRANLRLVVSIARHYDDRNRVEFGLRSNPAQHLLPRLFRNVQIEQNQVNVGLCAQKLDGGVAICCKCHVGIHRISQGQLKDLLIRDLVFNHNDRWANITQ